MTTTALAKEGTTKRKTLVELLNDDSTHKRFEEMLGKDARSFQQNILTVYNGNKSLQQCDPESIIAACAISASINLSILPSLGQSCIVPYKDGDRLVATWQIQWKGIVQLAHRSGQYKRVNLAHVYDGQLVSYDEFKGIVHLRTERKSDRVQGYYFFFELLNGMQMEFYWSAKKCVEHGLRFSKSFQAGGGKWTEDDEFTKAKTIKAWLAGTEHFLTDGSGADAMAAKTIVKNSLNKWGPLETRIKEIVNLDQAVITPDGTPKYVDTTAENAAAPKTYTAPPMGETKDKPFPVEVIAWARDAAEKLGLPRAQFDAWLEQQVGDEQVKADKASAAWKKVAAKQATVAEAFAIEAPAEKGPEVQSAEFSVYGVATADVDGNPDCWVIRDTSDPAVKHFTDDKKIQEKAKSIKGTASKLSVKFVFRGEGKEAYRWITALA
jgi:recombination protein RecT